MAVYAAEVGLEVREARLADDVAAGPPRFGLEQRAPTHLATTGYGHSENALRYGATAAEIIETMRVTPLVDTATACARRRR